MRRNCFARVALIAGLLASGVVFGQNRGYPPGYPGPPRYPSDPGESSYDSYGYGQDPSSDVGFFYDELSPYGDWVQREPYGWVWLPRDVTADWRPYEYGRWVDSDYGWTWVSDEPFGWATYHYGRWAPDPEIGWVWVPGSVWGPAWVAWQQGGGYVGWAPLPPEVGFEVGFGLRLGGLDLRFAVQPTRFCFVDERQFLEPRLGGYIVPRARNVSIIRDTTDVTRYSYAGGRVIDESVAVDRIERATGRRVQRVRVAEATSPSAGRGGVVTNDQVRIYRPPAERLRTVRVARRNDAGLSGQAAPPNPSTQAGPDRQPATEPAPRNRRPATMLVAPRVRPVPGEDLDNRQRQEQTNFQRQEDNERQRLERIHQQEMAQPRDQARAAEMTQRHAAEVQAQQQERQRDEQQMRNRQQIAREAARASAEKARQPAKPARPPGRQRNKDKDKTDDQQPPPS